MIKEILGMIVSIAVLQTVAAESSCMIGNGKYLSDNRKLQVHKFLGTYHTLYLYPKNFLDKYRCWIDNYYMFGVQTVHSTGAYSVRDGKRLAWNGNITYTQPHMMLKEFPTWPELTYNFNIIATDYTNFSIFGGCPQATEGKPLIWIGFRNPNATESEIESAKKKIEENGLRLEDFDAACLNKEEYKF